MFGHFYGKYMEKINPRAPLIIVLHLGLVTFRFYGRTRKLFICMIPGFSEVSMAQKTNIPAPPDNKKVSIVGLEVSPLRGGGLRYIAGYPNFHAITAWNHSNRYAMAVTELAQLLL